MRRFVFITAFMMLCGGAILYQNATAVSVARGLHGETLPTIVPTATGDGSGSIPTIVPTATDNGNGSIPTIVPSATDDGNGTIPATKTPVPGTPAPTATKAVATGTVTATATKVSSPTPTILETLKLTVSADKTRVAPGTSLVFTMSILNTGKAPAENVIVRGIVPKYTTFNARNRTSANWEQDSPTTAPAPALRPILHCFEGTPAGAVCANTIERIGAGEVESLIFAVKLDLDIPFDVKQISLEIAINEQGFGGAFSQIVNVDIDTSTRALIPLIARDALLP